MGLRGDVNAYLKEIRPGPMILAVLSGLLGAIIACTLGLMELKTTMISLYMVAVFLILYSAHLVDTYNDLFKRREYSHGYKSRLLDSGENPLSKGQYLWGIAVSIAIASIIGVWLILMVGWGLAVLGVVGIALALSYGSGLDKVFIAGDLAWEFGVIGSILGGYYVQAGGLHPPIIVVCIMIIPILTGAKIIDAMPDIEPDKHSGKNTIPVKIGFRNSERLAYTLIWIGWGILITGIGMGLFPTQMILGAWALAPFVAASQFLGPYRAGVHTLLAGVVILILWGIWVLFP